MGMGDWERFGLGNTKASDVTISASKGDYPYTGGNSHLRFDQNARTGAGIVNKKSIADSPSFGEIRTVHTGGVNSGAIFRYQDPTHFYACVRSRRNHYLICLDGGNKDSIYTRNYNFNVVASIEIETYYSRNDFRYVSFADENGDFTVRVFVSQPIRNQDDYDQYSNVYVPDSTIPDLTHIGGNKWSDGGGMGLCNVVNVNDDRNDPAYFENTRLYY